MYIACNPSLLLIFPEKLLSVNHYCAALQRDADTEVQDSTNRQVSHCCQSLQRTGHVQTL